MVLSKVCLIFTKTQHLRDLKNRDILPACDLRWRPSIESPDPNWPAQDYVYLTPAPDQSAGELSHMTITLLLIGRRRARDAAVTIQITPHLIETGIKKGGLEQSWMALCLPVYAIICCHSKLSNLSSPSQHSSSYGGGGCERNGQHQPQFHLRWGTIWMSLKQGQAAFLDAVLCRLYDWASLSPAYYAECPEDCLFYLELDWGSHNLAREIKLILGG